MIFKTYETERLTLRLATINDAALTLELLNMPKWLKYIGDRNVHTLAEAQTYIRHKMLPQSEKLGYGNYVVLRREDGVKLGFCGVYDREGLEGVDIGFSVLERYERNGYAFEAAKCLKNAAFRDFKVSKIGGITHPENVVSQKLLEKLGLKFVKNIVIGGEQLMYFELGGPT